MHNSPRRFFLRFSCRKRVRGSHNLRGNENESPARPFSNFRRLRRADFFRRFCVCRVRRRAAPAKIRRAARRRNRSRARSRQTRFRGAREDAERRSRARNRRSVFAQRFQKRRENSRRGRRRRAQRAKNPRAHDCRRRSRIARRSRVQNSGLARVSDARIHDGLRTQFYPARRLEKNRRVLRGIQNQYFPLAPDGKSRLAPRKQGVPATQRKTKLHARCR